MSFDLTFKPVTPDTLPEFNRFSEAHGKFRYCSCMRWRFTSSRFSNSSKTDRIESMQQRIEAAEPVGLLAFDGDTPIGWCSVAPRSLFSALERSRVLPRLDDEPVWSITCFFIDSKFRRQGVTGALLEAALAYAAENGARIVEGYPVPPDASSYTYMGSPHTFEKAGFKDVTPPGNKRQIMRAVVNP